MGYKHNMRRDRSGKAPKARRRGNDNDSDENLRGQLRDLKKQNKTLMARVKQLERRLRMHDDLTLDKQADEMVQAEAVTEDLNPEKKCKTKGCHGIMDLSVIWSPKGEISWWKCQKCQHKERG